MGYRAYNKQGVRIKILDDLLEKIFGMLNAKKKETVVDTKKDENIENSSGNLKEKVEDPFAELDKIEKN
ncbi:MAG: hypothetical protein LBU14_03935 [Candidatus Peribacteria bacterium]|nr:hypothetical protein [Candidatus Peribacteria bacterium]